MLLKKKGLSDEIKPLLSHPVYTTDLYIIFNKQRISKEFVDGFSRALKNYKSTRNYQSLYQTYFSHHEAVSTYRVEPNKFN